MKHAWLAGLKQSLLERKNLAEALTVFCDQMDADPDIVDEAIPTQRGLHLDQGVSESAGKFLGPQEMRHGRCDRYPT